YVSSVHFATSTTDTAELRGTCRLARNRYRIGGSIGQPVRERKCTVLGDRYLRRTVLECQAGAEQTADSPPYRVRRGRRSSRRAARIRAVATPDAHHNRQARRQDVPGHHAEAAPWKNFS